MMTLSRPPNRAPHRATAAAHFSPGDPNMLLAEIANDSVTVVTRGGITLGAAIAIVCSWQRNKSILWAILAGILSWFYVIYFAITRKPDEVK
jgi:hypothetical protein